MARERKDFCAFIIIAAKTRKPLCPSAQDVGTTAMDSTLFTVVGQP